MLFNKTRLEVRGRVGAALFVLLLVSAITWAAPPVPADLLKSLNHYQSPYYVIHTDLSIEQSREAFARMTAMAEVYHAKTRDFAGKITKKLPFYLLSNKELYYKAGGMPNTAGVFTGDRLMALAREGRNYWPTVQHEGFHQFAHYVIRGKRPTWINEGMAGYFEVGLWTGDGFVTGYIPQWKLDKLREIISQNRLMPFEKMVSMSHAEWNQTLMNSSETGGVNYIQAWSMVHFLVHGDDGRYRDAFSNHIKDLSRGMDWKKSFSYRFGNDIAGFQNRYQQWWSQVEQDEGYPLFTQSVVETLTSYLARAHLNGMRFSNIGRFLEACEAGIEVNPQKFPYLWLPQSLLKDKLEYVSRVGTWSLKSKKNQLPKIICTGRDGVRYTGSFRLNGKSRPTITVDIKGMRSTRR